MITVTMDRQEYDLLCERVDQMVDEFRADMESMGYVVYPNDRPAPHPVEVPDELADLTTKAARKIVDEVFERLNISVK